MESSFNYTYRGDVPNKKDNKGVIILLHGYGDNYINFHNNIVTSLLDEYFIITLKAPLNVGSGDAWCDITFDTGSKKYDLVQMEESRNFVIDFIDYVKNCYDIDSNNVILFGNSQGAVLTQVVALTSPNIINASVSLSGYVKHECINDNIADVEDIKKLEFFIGHGSMDLQVHISLDRKSKNYLESLGVSLDYNEYPIGHIISIDELNDINSWLSKLNDNLLGIVK